MMAYLTDHHFEFGGLLYGGVRWNTKDKGGTLPVNNLAGVVQVCLRKW